MLTELGVLAGEPGRDTTERAVPIEHLSDESILLLYENVRQQVAADIRTGSPYRLVGNTAKKEAERLRLEIDRRGLQAAPIVWE